MSSEHKNPNETTEIVREKTMQMTRDIRTGLFTVVADSCSSAVKRGKQRAETFSRSRRRKHFFFHRKKLDVDALIAEQFVSVPCPVDYSPVENFDKAFPLDAMYETGSVFAEGGQGVLRTATDRELRRTVAVKSLKRSRDPKQLESFLREAKVTAQLDHPSILPIYSLNTDSGKTAHLVMRHIKGCTLKEYLERIDSFYRIDGVDTFDERRSLFRRLDLFLRICDALEYAHNRNIMHRDLKPENIMIGEYRDVYIMDWGIACPIHEPGYDPENWVPPKTIMGTPRYVSPEAVRGEHCDQRADIYALGLILYEMVTLNEAYNGMTGEEVLQRVGRGDINTPEHRYDVPIDDDMYAIIMKATDPQPDNRYCTVGEFADDIRRYIRNEEVKANPDSLLNQIFRWCSHHPRLIAGISIAVILISLLSASALIINRIRVEKEREAVLNVTNQAFARNLYIAEKIERMLTAKAIQPEVRHIGKRSVFSLPENQKYILLQRLAQYQFYERALSGKFIYRIGDGEKIMSVPVNKSIPAQLFDAVRKYTAGTFYTVEDDRYFLWCYARIPAVKWVYIECFSVRSLRLEQAEMKKKNGLSGRVLHSTRLAPLPF